MKTNDWKTTVSGILMIAITALKIWQNPAGALTDPQTYAGAAAGSGLIAAADSKKRKEA